MLVRVHAVNVLARRARHRRPGRGRHALSSSRCARSKPKGAASSFSSATCGRNPCPIGSTRRNMPGARKTSSKERRQVEIGVGSQILADLGVTDMVLLDELAAARLRRSRSIRAAHHRHTKNRVARHMVQKAPGPRRRTTRARIRAPRAYAHHRGALLRRHLRSARRGRRRRMREARRHVTSASSCRARSKFRRCWPQRRAARAAGRDDASTVRSPSAASFGARRRTTTSSATMPITG